MFLKLKSFNKKPLENDISKQLFSYDVSFNGAKNFIFETYENIYDIIKKESTSNFYEDNTFSLGIKLFVDFDEKRIFNTKLERDKYAEQITLPILPKINNKLYNLYKVESQSIIILISDT